MIAVLAGRDDPNINAPLRDGADQFGPRAPVGQKVGRRDPNSFLC
jgi:hypothetical protein